MLCRVSGATTCVSRLRVTWDRPFETCLLRPVGSLCLLLLRQSWATGSSRSLQMQWRKTTRKPALPTGRFGQRDWWHWCDTNANWWCVSVCHLSRHQISSCASYWRIEWTRCIQTWGFQGEALTGFDKLWSSPAENVVQNPMHRSPAPTQKIATFVVLL